MSQNAPVQLPNDDFISLVRLSEFTGVPIPQVAGVLLCRIFDNWDQATLSDIIREDLARYRNQLSVRWPQNGLDKDLYPIEKEVISDEQTVTTDVEPV